MTHIRDQVGDLTQLTPGNETAGAQLDRYISRLQYMVGSLLEDGWMDRDIPHVMKRNGIKVTDCIFRDPVLKQRLAEAPKP